MNDIITSTLAKGQHKRKPLQVIKRYLKVKYRILISEDLLMQRIQGLKAA